MNGNCNTTNDAVNYTNIVLIKNVTLNEHVSLILQVWLLAMDRRRKLQDALDKQNEVGRVNEVYTDKDG
jgi:hypothetical protein